MSWRERYRPALFRDVAFHVEAADFESGRRGADHVYPGRDEPYAEDAGRRPRGYHVTAYTIGDDYDLDRDRLVAALEAEGPGTLVHPYLGEVRVVARQFSVRMSSREGGIAIFEVDFVEAGRNLAPVSATDTSGALTESAETAGVGLEDSFAVRFLADAPSWITNAASAAVNAVADKLDKVFAPATALAEGADNFRRGLIELRGDVNQLVLEPILLARRVRGLLRQYAGIPASTSDSFWSMLGLAGSAFDFDAINESTGTRSLERRNRDAIVSLLRRPALFEAAAVLPEVYFASRGDVIAARDALESAFEAEILAAGDDPAQDADLRQIENVFAAAMKELAARDDGTLAQLRIITLPAAQPALVVSHRLYQDANRDQEIVDRNRVVHPLFVPGGVPLQVLSVDRSTPSNP